jgi:hypothetical protein
MNPRRASVLRVRAEYESRRLGMVAQYPPKVYACGAQALLNSSESKSILEPFKGLVIPASAGSE